MNTHIVSKSFALSKYRNLLGARKSHEKKEKKKKKRAFGVSRTQPLPQRKQSFAVPSLA